MTIRENLTECELGILFSNLAKGCEKQYKKEESELFVKLSDYYYSKANKPKVAALKDLEKMVKVDLAEFAVSKEVAVSEKDRGALRAFIWSEKVSKIVSSIITRYEKTGNKLLENTNIHVCEICGFVYLGDEPPKVCPVCKVPNFKISKIRR